MARRYWRIPSSSLGEKKFEFPTRGFAARGEFIFFTSGFGGNSPIPPRHPQAIISLYLFLNTYLSLYNCIINFAVQFMQNSFAVHFKCSDISTTQSTYCLNFKKSFENPQTEFMISIYKTSRSHCEFRLRNDKSIIYFQILDIICKHVRQNCRNLKKKFPRCPFFKIKVK